LVTSQKARKRVTDKLYICVSAYWIMLDPKTIRDNPKIVKDSLKRRGLDQKELGIILDLDKKWRDIKSENDRIRSQRNKISLEINLAKKQGKDIKPIVKKAKDIPKKLEKNETRLKELEEKRLEILENIPNIVDKSVPVGDPSKNKVLKTFGKAKKNIKARGHEEVLTDLDLLDIERAAKVAGSRFYYLKGDLVKLNQAIINFALSFLQKKGFILMQPPYMLNKKALKSALNLAAFEETIYKIEGEDLYLIATAEHALNSYHMNEVLDVSKPIRYAGISPCFRKEAGSHGKDTKGIFRIHQFEKIEQFVFCKPEDSWKEFDSILSNTIGLFKELGIPFRTVLLSSQDMGRTATKTIDVEGWYPSQGQYRELASCSNCLDYQARRANIKYIDHNERKFVHTLNNTAIATERMITCLVDNFQQKDGSIAIPKVLQKFMGIKAIKPVKKAKK